MQLRKNAGGARSKSANLALSCQPEGFVLNWDIDLKSIRIAIGVPCHRHRTIVTFKKRDERGLILNEPARWHQIHDVELHYNDISALLNKTSLIQRLTVFIEGKGRQVAFFRPPSILKHFMIKMTGRSGLTEPKSIAPAGQMSRVGGMTSISILITLSLENPASVFRIRPSDSTRRSVTTFVRLNFIDLPDNFDGTIFNQSKRQTDIRRSLNLCQLAL